MESLLNAFRSLGPGRILSLFVGLAAVIAIAGLTVSRLNTPGLALLYGGLSAQESSAISQYLDSQSIAYEIKDDGSVYVPADQVGQLRLQVAGQGMVGGSTGGYELFDNTSAFGTTNFVQNLNAKRALEGELARTIATLPAVTGARVHIVLPKQNLFSREEIVPTAAVALNLGNRTLEAPQVNSIAQLVASAVPNLTTRGITIIDQRGGLLFDGKNQDGSAGASNKVREGIEKSYETALTSMLERVVGTGKASVKVNADVNLDKVQENSEIFDPTQQVARSEQTIESSSASGGGDGGLAGVQGNIPGGSNSSASGTSNSDTRTETTTNYEIGKTVRSLTREGGDIRKISVAVLIEGRTAVNETGQTTYTPYTEDELGRFRRLIESGIGFDAARGDRIDIVDMQFSTPAEPPAVAEPIVNKDQILQFVQYGMLIMALLVVAMMVVKPALAVLTQALATNAPIQLPAPQEIGPLVAQGAGGQAGGGGESMLDIKRVEGRVKESSVKKVHEIIDQNPEESLNVVRTWMGGASTQDDGS